MKHIQDFWGEAIAKADGSGVEDEDFEAGRFCKW